MKNKVLAALLVFGIQGCSTIYFQSDAKSTYTAYSEWHHDWLYGLIEGSDPVDMSVRCKGNEWRTVKTQESFLQGLVSGITYNHYTPHGVEYSCMKAAATPAAAPPAPVKR